MDNRVQKFRKAKGLSQKQLAELVGTSQQQIQRIENNLITAKLEVAIKLAHALDKPLNSVFPGSGKALDALQNGPAKSRSAGLDDLRNTGIEGDSRIWFFKVHLRGHAEPMVFRIPTSEKDRLYLNVQDETDHLGDGVAFVVFDTLTERIALNLSEVLYCQFLYEIGPFYQEAEEEEEWSCTATVYFNSVVSPLFLSLEPEYEDQDSDMGQCHYIFSMVELDTAPGDTYRLIDADGDDTFIRIGSVALLSVSLTAIEPPLEDMEDDDEE